MLPKRLLNRGVELSPFKQRCECALSGLHLSQHVCQRTWVGPRNAHSVLGRDITVAATEALTPASSDEHPLFICVFKLALVVCLRADETVGTCDQAMPALAERNSSFLMGTFGAVIPYSWRTRCLRGCVVTSPYLHAS